METSALTTPVTNSQSASASASNTATINALSDSLTNVEFSDLMQLYGDVSENSASQPASSSIMSSTTADKVSGTAAPVASPLPITSSSPDIHDNHDTRNLSTSQIAEAQAKYDLQLSNTSAYFRSLGQTLAANSANTLNVFAS